MRLSAGAGAAEFSGTTRTAREDGDVPEPVPRLTRVVMPQSRAPGYPIVVPLRVTLDEQGRVGEVRALGPGSGMYTFYVSRPTGADVLAFGPATE